MPRIIVGGLLVLFGVSALCIAAAFLTGPLLYLRDPFAAEAAQRHATIVGVAALMLGSLTITTALLKTRHAAPTGANNGG